MKSNQNGFAWLFRLVAVVIALPCFASTYYVDSSGGNDANSGTTTNAAWQTLGKVNGTTFQPGDKILFKAGGVWAGTTQLHPLGSGATNNPIVIDLYGSGSKPIINAGSATGNGAVYLSNQSFWEINNLEITSDAGSDGDRRGVDFIATSGTSTHLYLRNCYIHNIRGTFQSTDGGSTSLGKRTGGILVEVPSGSASFNDILIENNEIKTVRNEGLVACLGASSAKNVIIRGNVLHDVTKNGMVIRVCDGTCLIEHNLCYNTATLTTGNTMFTAGVNGPVFQYNEAYSNLAGDHDGSMYDADLNSKNVIFQYSYSHDNSHGLFWQYASGGDTGNICRYNISQNDQGNIFSLSGSGSGSDYIYNNTVYINPAAVNSVSHYVIDDRTSGHTEYFYNNIIYNLNGSTYHLTSGNTHTFDYNVFYGQHPATEPADAHKLTSDPMLVAPGTGATSATNSASSTNDLASLVGYKLQAGSPCIDSGLTIANNGGLDFFGNTVPFNGAVDRGANEWTGAATNLPPQITGQPVSQSSCQAQTVTLSVSASGSSPLIFQWYFNTNTPISSATNSSLVLNNVTTTDAGNYSIVVTNVSGSVTSSYAVLTISTNVPASIGTPPQDQTTANGGSASFNVVPAGTGPFTFQWQGNGSDISGATNATLALSNVTTNNAGTYDVVVANTCGIVVSSNAVLTVNDPPTISAQPTNQTVLVGSGASFSVTASGTPPLTYQWYFNTNTPLAVGTNAILSLSNVSSNNAGNYDVVIANIAGSVTSAVAMLTVNQSSVSGGTNTLLYETFTNQVGWTLGTGWTTNSTTPLTNSQGVGQGMYANFTPGTTGNYLTSPTVNAAGNTSLQLSFYATHSTGFTGNLQVDASSDGGTNWSSVTNIANANIMLSSGIGPVQGPFSLGSGFDNKSQVTIRFSATGTLGTSSPRLRIDNVLLTGLSVVMVAPPQITATFATNVLPNSVQLNAQVIAGGAPAAGFFVFGTSTNYGSVTASNNLPAGTNLVSVTNLITGLTPGTVYHFQAFASGSAGSTNLADATFTTLGISPPQLTAQVTGGENLQINFTSTPGASFTILVTTNLSLTRSNWTSLGGVNQIAPGQFQFSEAATNRPARFYQIRSP